MAAQSVNMLITGANRGLGLEMVGQIVKGSIPVKKLIACCRDPNGPTAEVSSELLLLSARPQCQQFCSMCHWHVNNINKITDCQAGKQTRTR